MNAALVTGCSTGIGFATALRLAGDGLDVVATMRDPERDGPALLDAAEAAGVPLRLRQLDVTDDESVARAFEGLDDLAVLVNNAAIMWMESAEATEVEQWRQTFDTNVLGAVRCMRAALPIMRARGNGCIVNVSSVGGVVAMPATSAYGASKAALEAASEIVAIEARPHGIRVVVIQTGATATAMGAKVRPPDRDSPYWGSLRNTLVFLGAQRLELSSPDVIADAIARAAHDPESPFRVVAGQGGADLLRARASMSDEDWIATAGGSNGEFARRYEHATGKSLTISP